MNRKALTIIGGLTAVIVAAGCGLGDTTEAKREGGSSSTSTPAPLASTSTAPANEPASTRDGEPAPFGRNHGWKYEDGLTVSIDSVSTWRPGAYAAGHKPGNKAIKVKVTITNGTDGPFDASMVDVKAAFGPDGTQAETVYDEAVTGMDGTVAKGRTKTATFGFSAPGKINPLELSVEPGWDYQAALFSGSVK